MIAHITNVSAVAVIQIQMKADTQLLTRGDKSLSDHSQEYHDLIGAEIKEKIKQEKRRNDRWTGIVSIAHFTIAGCHVSHLTEDVDDAWAEIDAIHGEGVPPWEFLFNAAEHELPNSATNIELYRLPADELEDLGKKVTRLRAQASERAAAIESTGDAADTARLPAELNRQLLNEHAKL